VQFVIHTLIPLQLFDGAAINDSIRGNRAMLLIAHGSIYGADLGTSPLIEPNSLVSMLDAYEQSDIVRLGAMLYHYDRLKPSVVEDSLIYYDGLRFRHSNPTAISESYQRDTLAVLATVRKSIHGSEIPFVLPSTIYSSNLAAGIVAMDIDFGDGLGYRPLVADQVYTIHYATADTFRIDIRWALLGGQYRYASTSIIVEDATSGFDRGIIGQVRSMLGYSNAPDRVHHIPTGPGCTIHIWDNKDCDRKVRKPLILIKGFDPTNSIQPDYVLDGSDGLLDIDYGIRDANNELVNLKDLIHDEGYTLFFITMDNSTVRVQENAVTTKVAIDWINAQKRAAGSTEKNIVIGASMGGLIGKWVLQEYEINGQDHETELFISYDSPLKGANIPLALQAIPLAIGQQHVLFGTYLRHLIDELNEGWKSVSSPAARQMLYYYLGDCRSGCTAAELSAQHDAFYTEFEARGNLKIPHIALANGSVTGEGMAFGPGAMLIRNDLIPDEGFWDLGAAILAPFGPVIPFIFSGNNVIMEVEGYAMPGFIGIGHNVIAKNAWKFKKWGIQVFSKTEVISLNTTDAQANSSSGYIWYDNVPGALREFQSGKKTQGWKYNSFCFIPTVNALDLPAGTDPFTDLSDRASILASATHLRSAIGSEDAGLYYGVTQTNMAHVTLNNKLAVFLLTSLKSLDLYLQ